MKKFKIFTTLVLAFAFLGCQSLQKKEESFKPIAHQTEELKNGLKILWIPDDRIPYYSLKLMLPVGSAHDPAQAEGAAQMTAALLDKGTSKHGATQIAKELEQLGLSFAAAADEDSTFVSISGLSIYASKATEEFYTLLTDSTFSAAELKRQVELTQAQLKRSFDQPRNVASVALEKVLYGKHPYAHLSSGDLKSLAHMNRKKVLDFYHAHYGPRGAVLAVVGKFGPTEQKQIRDLFSSWKVQSGAVTALPQPEAVKPQVIFLEKSGLKQAEIRFGHLGIARATPDYLTLRVANTILGESFIGKLFSEIREKRGLTYSIYSYFDPREVAGPFVISTFTRLDKIPEMITETQKVLSDFTQGVSDQDVKDAVSYLKGSFPQIIETGEDLARQLLILERYHVDPSYLADFMSNVSKVTPAQVNGVLKTYFRPQDLVIVVFGPPGAQVGLEKFGSVKTMKPEDLY
jgi:zinc protease